MSCSSENRSSFDKRILPDADDASGEGSLEVLHRRAPRADRSGRSPCRRTARAGPSPNATSGISGATSPTCSGLIAFKGTAAARRSAVRMSRKHVAPGDLLELVVGVAASSELGEQGRVAGDIVESDRHRPTPSKSPPTPMASTPAMSAHVIDVVGDVSDRRGDIVLVEPRIHGGRHHVRGRRDARRAGAEPPPSLHGSRQRLRRSGTPARTSP